MTAPPPTGQDHEPPEPWPPYEAGDDGRRVFKRPREHKVNGVTHIHIGFPVCRVETDIIGAAGVRTVATLMNLGSLGEEMAEALKDARAFIVKAIRVAIQLDDFDPTDHPLVRRIDAVLPRVAGLLTPSPAAAPSGGGGRPAGAEPNGPFGLPEFGP